MIHMVAILVPWFKVAPGFEEEFSAHYSMPWHMRLSPYLTSLVDGLLLPGKFRSIQGVYYFMTYKKHYFLLCGCGFE
uniref:Uncharacterized protein n=1 Tax=Arundo donax TaxID=35708 RepID=A0A0A9ARB8_ARUDO